MPLVVVPLDLPPDVVELRAGDLDGDGRAEVVVASTVDGRGKPDGLRLTVVGGAPLAPLRTHELGQAAHFWDVAGGLYAVDGQGLVRFTEGGPKRLASLVTPLAGLGPTTPVHAPFLVDADHDGVSEALVYAGGRVHLLATDGRALGAVELGSHGSLASRDDQGGFSLRATQRAPTLLVADLDGDGRDDLVSPEGNRLRVWPMAAGPALAGAGQTWKVPLDLARDDSPGGGRKTRREVTQVLFADLDGDGRDDLVAQVMVSEGSWLGSTAELVVLRNAGGSFSQVQVLTTGVGSTGAELVDADGDGDLDLLLTQVDIGFTNLARGLVSRSITADCALFPNSGGRFEDKPRLVAQLAVSLEQPRVVLDASADLDGDGRLELVTAQDGALRVARGGGGGWGDTLLGEATLGVAAAAVAVGDVTGDGRDDLVFWAPGERRAAVVSLR